jgi:ribosome-binding factor A
MKEYSRKVRINSQLQADLSDIIRTHLGDPRVQGVTITSADISPDLHNCKVMVSVLGDDAALKAAVDGLNHAAGKVRHELAQRLRLRIIPNLRVVGDTGMREADRITQLIRSAITADQQAHAPKKKRK